MRQLSATDAMMVFLETDPYPNQTSLLLICDQSTAPNGLVRFKQIVAKMDSAVKYAPNFGCRLLRVPFNLDDPYWIPDPGFEIEYHVRHVALPKPGDWRQLSILIARLISIPLHKSKPLWEMYVIEGLDEVEGLSQGCFAVLLKMHHGMIDGQGVMALLDGMLDLQPRPKRKKTNKHPPEILAPDPTGWSLAATALRRLARKPRQLASVLKNTVPGMLRHRKSSEKPAVAVESIPGTILNGKLTPPRVFDTHFYRLDGVKKIRALVPGSTVNDVTIAVTAGALRRYLLAKDALPQSTLTAQIPISTRSAATRDTAGGNELVTSMVPICTHIADPVRRLEAICDVMVKTKSYVNAVGAKTMQQINTAVPGALMGTLARAVFQIGQMRGRPMFANVVITNVPGSAVPQYLCGAKIVRLTGGAPPLGDMGLAVSVGSYDGWFNFGIVACRDLLPDPGFFMQCVDESIEEYMQLSRSTRAPDRPAPQRARVRASRASGTASA